MSEKGDCIAKGGVVRSVYGDLSMCQVRGSSL